MVASVQDTPDLNPAPSESWLVVVSGGQFNFRPAQIQIAAACRRIIVIEHRNAQELENGRRQIHYVAALESCLGSSSFTSANESLVAAGVATTAEKRPNRTQSGFSTISVARFPSLEQVQMHVPHLLADCGRSISP